MLHYQLQGKGPIWLFLHGFLESSSMWDALPLSDLPITKLFIDLPGHGKSELLDQNPSIRAMALEVQKVLLHLDIQKFTIVGHSMGAYVGLELSQQPGFQKLVLLNSNCWSDSEQKKQDRLRVAAIVHKAKYHFVREAIPNLFSHPESHPHFIDSLVKEANEMTPESIAFAALAMRERTDFTAYLNDHPEQFIFIHGKLDRLVSVDELDAKIKGPRIYLLDSGHMAHVETREELMAIFASFI
jgi:pimeloyl-ACP methyl ester carboxylesterase